MSMTAYDIWKHLCVILPYSEWEEPGWFKWPNTYTPKQVDELIRKEKPRGVVNSIVIQHACDRGNTGGFLRNHDFPGPSGPPPLPHQTKVRGES